MGTNNFHYENVLRIVEIEDDDCIVSDTIENIRSEFNEQKDYSFVESGKDIYELRSFPSLVLGMVYERFDHTPETDICINVTVVLRHGYYAHANLDYIVTISTNGGDYSLDEWNEMVDALVFDSIEIYGDEYENQIINGVDALDTHVTKMVKYVDSVLLKYSTPAVKIGQFQNGEAVYQTA
jgi:hypothetical protein